jgi:hypothetical protein
MNGRRILFHKVVRSFSPLWLYAGWMEFTNKRVQMTW